MAFLRIERKKSGTYMRIVKSYRVGNQVRHKTIHSLGKAEDYTPQELVAIAKKLVLLAEEILEREKQKLKEQGE